MHLRCRISEAAPVWIAPPAAGMSKDPLPVRLDEAGRSLALGGGALYAQAFFVLWSVAHLAHALRKEPFNDAFSWLNVLACVLLLLRPGSAARLAGLCVAQIALFVDRMPITDNHLYIMAFVNAGLLVVALPLALRRQAWSPATFGVARTYVAVVFLGSYAAAALSKLNPDFLFSEASCALSMLDDAGRAVGLDRTALPASMADAVPLLVAGTELAIPLLLALRRTRAVGIGVTVAFHLAISLSPTATAIDFTVAIAAVLFLFLPPSDRLGADLEALRRSVERVVGRLDRGAVGAGLLFGVMVVYQWRLGTVAGNRGWALLAITAVGLGAALVAAVVRDRGTAERAALSPRRLRPAHVALLGLALLNVAAPYLGWKTAGTYTMYSNLDTFEATSNHYLFPRLNPGTFQDDLVEILDTSNERLDRVRERGDRITWHELRRVLARDPEARIAYRRGGERIDHARAADDPALVTRDPVLHKLLGHRAQAAPPGRCLW